MTNGNAALKEQILGLSRQVRLWPLTQFFSDLLDKAIAAEHFPDPDQLLVLNDAIISTCASYRRQSQRNVVVLGMSGGIDSALTAALFQKAGYRVVGVTMPIHQEPAETERGVAACQALEIEHLHIDLSDLYDTALSTQTKIDPAILHEGDDKAVRIRRGNVRARLRMITVYNLASALHGIVASTDNFSELAAGFWTLHGDVGDFCPIQSLLKSWEVPYLARLNGVPEQIVEAVPTDGLGIDAGDEAQLGCSYLEWDLMVFALIHRLPVPEEEPRVPLAVTQRMAATWHKRRNPIRVPHPLEDRYQMLGDIDGRHFDPRIADRSVHTELK